jgi:hypothetical protein
MLSLFLFDSGEFITFKLTGKLPTQGAPETAAGMASERGFRTGSLSERTDRTEQMCTATRAECAEHGRIERRRGVAPSRILHY